MSCIPRPWSFDIGFTKVIHAGLELTVYRTGQFELTGFPFFPLSECQDYRYTTTMPG